LPSASGESSLVRITATGELIEERKKGETIRTTEGGHDCINTRAGGGLLSCQMSLDILYTEGLRAVGLHRRQGLVVFRVGGRRLRSLPLAIRDRGDDRRVIGTACNRTAALRTRAHVRGERYTRDALSPHLRTCGGGAKLCGAIALTG